MRALQPGREAPKWRASRAASVPVELRTTSDRVGDLINWRRQSTTICSPEPSPPLSPSLDDLSKEHRAPGHGRQWCECWKRQWWVLCEVRQCANASLCQLKKVGTHRSPTCYYSSFHVLILSSSLSFTSSAVHLPPSVYYPAKPFLYKKHCRLQSAPKEECPVCLWLGKNVRNLTNWTRQCIFICLPMSLPGRHDHAVVGP